MIRTTLSPTPTKTTTPNGNGGRLYSAETKQKMSASALARWQLWKGNRIPHLPEPKDRIKRPAKNNNLGRHPVVINWKRVDILCTLQCTGAEIASVLGISYAALALHVEQEHGVTFVEYYEAKRGAGRASLRRRQWAAARSGNPTMLIWLGKQYLGQADKTELSGRGGGPLELERRYLIIQQVLTSPEHRTQIAEEYRRLRSLPEPV